MSTMDSGQSERGHSKRTAIQISQHNHQSSPNAITSKVGSPGSASSLTPNGDGSLIRTAKATQLNAIKEDLEAESQILKEKALRELFNFEATSILACSQALVEMVEISAAYHRSCAAILEELAPLLRAELHEQCPLPVYGRSLETHLAVTHSKIAYPLRQCIRVLNNQSVLCEEGIFRIAGSKTKVDTLKSALNSLRAESVISQYDPYVVADAMKQYLRSLPQPLLTSHLLGEWTYALQLKDSDFQLRRLQQIAREMPPEYERNAGYLFRFLHRLTEYSTRNRMTPASLAIIFGPSLLPVSASISSSSSNPDETPATLVEPNSSCEQNGDVPSQLALQGVHRGLIELLIIHANEIFPPHSDGDDDEVGNNIDELEDSEELTQTSVSLASEPVSAASGRLHAPGEILSRRAQRAMTEFARQSRAIRTLPQRLRAKHSKCVTADNPVSPIRPVASSAPVGRSLTPVPTRKVTDFTAMPRLDRTWSLTQEEMSLVVEEPEESRKPFQQLRQPHRSVLQRQHMEWRKAMLEVAECGESGEGGGDQKFSIHGDLYDTLFTLQTLNNKSGVEDLLARVRSVYEAKSVMGRSALVPPSNGGTAVGSCDEKIGKGKAYLIRRHSTSSLSVLESHKSKINAASNIPTAAQPNPSLTSAAAKFRKKCSTTPGPLNGRLVQRVTLPPFAATENDDKRRPLSTLGRPSCYSTSESDGRGLLNKNVLTSTTALTTADDTDCFHGCSEALSRHSKRITLPRAGVDMGANLDRRKVISANITMKDYPFIFNEDKVPGHVFSSQIQE